MIYLDNNSTTNIDKRVLDFMRGLSEYSWGNSNSLSHKIGWQALDIVDRSRSKISKVINCKASRVIFTSGATESNNIIIKGFINDSKRNKILISAIEHSSILESSKYIKELGYIVEYIPVDNMGCLDIDYFKTMLDDTVALVSVMYVSNELGTIQDIKTISALSRSVGAIFHSDCAQALGRVPLDIVDLGVDVISLSSHKIYGPNGIGALVLGSGIKVKPLFHGGGQQLGFRSGTLATELCAGFSEACYLSKLDFIEDNKKILELRDKLESMILSGLPNVRVLVDRRFRVSSNIPLFVEGIQSQEIFSCLGDIAISSGSACNSSSKESYSNTLSAIGMNASQQGTFLRICVGRFNTIDEIKEAGNKINNILKALFKYN